MNKFPGDDESDISALRRDVEELKTLIRAQGGYTDASQGWVLRNMATPALPTSGDVHIYASGGRLRARSTLSDIALQQGAAVANPAAQTATPLSSGATVLGSDYNKMGADVDAIWDALVALLNSLRNNTTIAP